MSKFTPLYCAIALAGPLVGAGCAALSPVLVAAGVKPEQAAQISADAALAGQLMCQHQGVWVAPLGANVKGATAGAVAAVCAAAQPGAIAGMPPSGTVALVVTVADSALTALERSKLAPARADGTGQPVVAVPATVN